MWGDFSSEGTWPRVWGDLSGRSCWKVPGCMRGTISQVVTVPRPSLGLRAAATVLTREIFFLPVWASCHRLWYSCALLI